MGDSILASRGTRRVHTTASTTTAKATTSTATSKSVPTISVTPAMKTTRAPASTVPVFTTNFHYNRKRNLVGLFIGLFFTIPGFFAFRALIGFMSGTATDVQMFTSILEWAYVLFAVLSFIGLLLSMHGKSYQRLSINQSDIVYSSGWLHKDTITIPCHQIKSCSKSSRVLQRACGCMDITITTAGDGPEIVFCNVGNGDRAYDMVNQLTK